MLQISATTAVETSWRWLVGLEVQDAQLQADVGGHGNPPPRRHEPSGWRLWRRRRRTQGPAAQRPSAPMTVRPAGLTRLLLAAGVRRTMWPAWPWKTQKEVGTDLSMRRRRLYSVGLVVSMPARCEATSNLTNTSQGFPRP